MKKSQIIKKIEKYKKYVEIFSMKPEDMPRGSEYFQSGMFFIGNGGDTGDGHGDFEMSFASKNDIFIEHWFFHPVVDMEKNSKSPNRNYENRKPGELEKFKSDALKDIARGLETSKKLLKYYENHLTSLV